jgi:hypothetical protein
MVAARLRGFDPVQWMLHPREVRLRREREQRWGCRGGQEPAGIETAKLGIERRVGHVRPAAAGTDANAVHRVVIVGREHQP